MLKITRKSQKKISLSVVHLITDYRYLITATQRTAVLLSVALLSGCMGIYEGGFECPAGSGVGCKSISEVNQMVNQGELPKGEFSKEALQKIEVEPPTPRNYEIWYATSRKQESGTREQVSGSRSQENSFSKKENQKRAHLSDV